MQFSAGFITWAGGHKSPCLSIPNFKEPLEVCRECGNEFDDNLNPNDTICKTCEDWLVEGKGE